jgi:hypothetical protein
LAALGHLAVSAFDQLKPVVTGGFRAYKVRVTDPRLLQNTRSGRQSVKECIPSDGRLTKNKPAAMQFQVASGKAILAIERAARERI